jgi:hypothetical protein
MNGPELSSVSYPTRLFREIAARPLATVFSVVCVILFLLHASNKLKMDGYGIALLALTMVPWSLKAFAMGANTIGQALVHANIKSVPDCWG